MVLSRTWPAPGMKASRASGHQGHRKGKTCPRFCFLPELATFCAHLLFTPPAPWPHESLIAVFALVQGLHYEHIFGSQQSEMRFWF